MAWEEIALAIANTTLILPLLPTLIDTDAAVPRWTSVPTAACLLVIGTSYVSLSLWLAAISAYVQTVCWGSIAVWRPITTTDE